AKNLENTIALQKHAPKTIGVLPIVGRVDFVLFERDGVRNLVRLGIDPLFKIELFHFVHEPPVKHRDRLPLERKSRSGAAIVLDPELMLDKGEVYLKGVSGGARCC